MNGWKPAKENRMKKSITMVCAALMLTIAASSLSAAATQESTAQAALWNKANAIADASEQYLPGVRTIRYQETDGNGNTVFADQAVVLLEGTDNGRYITTREFGSSNIFDLMDRYGDGLIITPFSDAIEELSWTHTGVSETVNGRSTDAYTFIMAIDANALVYDPNYTDSGVMLGWDADDDDFDGSMTGTVWLDRITGAPVKLVNSFVFADNTATGSLAIEQTVYFTYANGIATPSQIVAKGSTSILAGNGGYIHKSNFTITEDQSSFWLNQKFARGQQVY
jgi:hypothetical protein